MFLPKMDMDGFKMVPVGRGVQGSRCSSSVYTHDSSRFVFILKCGVVNSSSCCSKYHTVQGVKGDSTCCW